MSYYAMKLLIVVIPIAGYLFIRKKYKDGDPVGPKIDDFFNKVNPKVDDYLDKIKTSIDKFEPEKVFAKFKKSQTKKQGKDNFNYS